MENVKMLDLSKFEKGYKLIVGIKNGKTKAGKVFQTIYYLDHFLDYDLDSSDACFGNTAMSVYSSRRYDLKPGDVVKMVYEPGFEGKAVLTDIVKK